jgi:hypothetical protein
MFYLIAVHDIPQTTIDMLLMSDSYNHGEVMIMLSAHNILIILKSKGRHNSILEMSVKRLLSCSLAVLLVSFVDETCMWFWCYLVYRKQGYQLENKIWVK